MLGMTPPDSWADVTEHKRVPKGSREEAALMRRLNQALLHNGSDFIMYSAKQNEWMNKHGVELQRAMSADQRRYVNNMQLMCLAPVFDGLSTDTMCQVLGMYIGMRLTSKSLRMQKKIDKTMRLQDKRARAVEKHPQREIRNRIADTITDARISRMWDGRVPYTAQTAAQQQIAFTRSAYDAMVHAQSSENPVEAMMEIRNSYAEAINTLYDLCELDGVQPEAVHRAARVYAEKLIDDDPDWAAVFNETAYGRVEREPVRSYWCEGPKGEPVYTEEFGGAYRESEFWAEQNGHADGRHMYETAFTPRVPYGTKGYEMDHMRDITGEMSFGRALVNEFDMLHVPGARMSNADVAAFAQDIDVTRKFLDYTWMHMERTQCSYAEAKAHANEQFSEIWDVLPKTSVARIKRLSSAFTMSGVDGMDAEHMHLAFDSGLLTGTFGASLKYMDVKDAHDIDAFVPDSVYADFDNTEGNRWGDFKRYWQNKHMRQDGKIGFYRMDDPEAPQGGYVGHGRPGYSTKQRTNQDDMRKERAAREYYYASTVHDDGSYDTGYEL